jgi:hypothetical protein
MKTAIAAALFAGALSTAALAQPAGAPRLTVGTIFADAGLFPKVILIVLFAAMIAAIVICVRKLSAGSKLSGGSAFVSGLRAGGPLLGLLGGGYGLLNITIGLTVLRPKDLYVVMPGVAETVFVILIGLLAGVVAVIAHWAIESRIDREVLKA